MSKQKHYLILALATLCLLTSFMSSIYLIGVMTTMPFITVIKLVASLFIIELGNYLYKVLDKKFDIRKSALTYTSFIEYFTYDSFYEHSKEKEKEESVKDTSNA